MLGSETGNKEEGRPALTWQVKVGSMTKSIDRIYFVDAHTGFRGSYSL